MSRTKRYYVIFEDDEWKVMLEEGGILRSFGSNRSAAIRYAKNKGEKNSRPVMVNYKSGATGAAYHSVDDLT